MTSQDPFTLLQTAQAALDKKLKSFTHVEPAVKQVFEQLQAANQHMQAGKFAEAAAAFDRVAELAATAKQTEIQAQARYSQGGMLATLPDRPTEAIAAFQQAANLFAQCDNPKMAQQAQQQIEPLRKRIIDVSDLNEAIAASTDQTPPRRRIELYGQRGRRYAKAGQFQQAMPDFEAAFAIARNTADSDLITLALSQVQYADDEGGQDIFSTALESLNQQVETSHDPVLQTMLTQLRPQLEQLLNLPEDLLKAIDIDALLNLDTSAAAAHQLQSRLTATLGQLQDSDLFKLITTVQAFQAIESALAGNQFQQALKLADAERQKSLHASDRQRYLRFALACILMSRAYEGLGDRPAVIEVLLYGKTTLEKAQGKAAGKPFLDLLNTLETRWGKDELLKARLTYREHMQRYGKYRLDV